MIGVGLVVKWLGRLGWLNEYKQGKFLYLCRRRAGREHCTSVNGCCRALPWRPFGGHLVLGREGWRVESETVERG